MKRIKNKLILFLLMIPLIISAQTGITLKIENLTKPDKLLKLESYDNIFKNLIDREANSSKYLIGKNTIDYQYNIVASSHGKDSLVNFGFHPFFQGMYQAYADHRPFVLSPDMIWLLISQGFSQHVNNNAEELRKLFVNFDGKLTLVVKNNVIDLKDPNSPWETVFPEFSKQISAYTGKDLINALTCDFSTTTPVSKVASEITIMEAMKSYFEYVVIYLSCGIPEVRLEGTPKDWQKVLDKANYLRKYKLDWWIDEIDPLLKKFVSASKGEADTAFWRNMFKYHTEKVYGSPKKIDGWIVKFFPYDKKGKRNNLQELIYGDNLPKELVKVDLKYIYVGGGKEIVTPLELWAGFMGLEQNLTTYALTPQIGWMIRKKDADQEATEKNNKLEGLNTQVNQGAIRIRVKTVPKELLGIESIRELSIDFIDEISIPEEMGRMKIELFRLTGKISGAEIERLCKLFPKTVLVINGKPYNEKTRPVKFI